MSKRAKEQKPDDDERFPRVLSAEDVDTFVRILRDAAAKFQDGAHQLLQNYVAAGTLAGAVAKLADELEAINQRLENDRPGASERQPLN